MLVPLYVVIIIIFIIINLCVLCRSKSTIDLLWRQTNNFFVINYWAENGKYYKENKIFFFLNNVT